MRVARITLSSAVKAIDGALQGFMNFSKSEHFFSYLVVGIVAFTQGLMGLSDLSISFLYKEDYGMGPSQVAFVGSIIGLPWVLKPIWGIISDCFPFMQFRRKSYLIACGLCSFTLWSLMAYVIRDKIQGFIALFLINICVSFCSVIAEALVVEISQKNAKSKVDATEEDHQREAAKNVSLFFGLRSVGALLVAYLGGKLLQTYSKYTIFSITSTFPLLVVLASACLDEDKVINDQTIVERTKEQIKSFCSFIKEPAIFKPILFILSFMIMPSSGSTMFFFYTNVLKFDAEFLGSLRLIYASGSIVATILYNQVLRDVPFKKQFAVSTIISCMFGMTQLLLVTRANQNLGIPDKMFTIGDSVMLQIVGELNLMPLLVLACRLCPKNIEGTMYALLMSTINLGSIASDQLGGLLTYGLGITKDTFTYLWVLVLITNSMQLLPLLYLNKVNLQKAQEVTGRTSKSENDQENEQIVKTKEEEEDVEEENRSSNKCKNNENMHLKEGQDSDEDTNETKKIKDNIEVSVITHLALDHSEKYNGL